MKTLYFLHFKVYSRGGIERVGRVTVNTTFFFSPKLEKKLKLIARKQIMKNPIFTSESKSISFETICMLSYNVVEF